MSVSVPHVTSEGERLVTAKSTKLSRRLPLPDTLLILDAPMALHPDLRASLSGWMRPVFLSATSDCAEHLRRTNSVAVLLTVPGNASDPVLHAYEQLRTAFHHTAFVAFYVSGHSELCALTRLASRNISQVLVSTRLHDVAHCYGALSASGRWHTAGRVWEHANIVADGLVTTLMLAALRLAHEPISLPQLALAARMHERTLRKYCARHGLPSPQWLIGWARCLLAAYYLEEDGRPIQTIAEILHFNSAVLLANHLRRYTQCSATELRRRGPLRTVSHCFESFLRTNRVPPIDSVR